MRNGVQFHQHGWHQYTLIFFLSVIACFQVDFSFLFFQSSNVYHRRPGLAVVTVSNSLIRPLLRPSKAASLMRPSPSTAASGWMDSKDRYGGRQVMTLEKFVWLKLTGRNHPSVWFPGCSCSLLILLFFPLISMVVFLFFCLLMSVIQLFTSGCLLLSYFLSFPWILFYHDRPTANPSGHLQSLVYTVGSPLSSTRVRPQ